MLGSIFWWVLQCNQNITNGQINKLGSKPMRSSSNRFIFQPQSLVFKHNNKSERRNVRKSGKISATSQTWHSGHMWLTKSPKAAIFWIKTNPHSTPDVKQIGCYTLMQDKTNMKCRERKKKKKNICPKARTCMTEESSEITSGKMSRFKRKQTTGGKLRDFSETDGPQLEASIWFLLFIPALTLP